MSRTNLLSSVSPFLLFLPRKALFPARTLFIRKMTNKQLEGCKYFASHGFYAVSDEHAENCGFFDGHKSAFEECKARDYTLVWAQ